MSYLIQNTYSTSNPLKVSLRVRSAFLVRNVHTIYALAYTQEYANRIASGIHSYNNQILLLSSTFFTRLIPLLFPNPKFLKFIPFGINFPLTAHYSSIVLMLKQLDKTLPVNTFPSLSNDYYKYPYFTRPQIAITNISKRPFTLALYKLLRLSLNLWCIWPRSYNFTSNYTNVTKGWLLLRFLNKYFFKVYSV